MLLALNGGRALYSEGVKVIEIIPRSAEFLAKKGVDSPRLQAELLLAHVLKVPRMRLYLDFERVLEPAEVDQYRELVRRRGQREPLQHIVGTTSFCGLEMAVNRQVLIPRPETEILAELGWKFLSQATAEAGGRPAALDFGTGSGCLAIAIAVKCPEKEVWAVDRSPDALAVARGNAERLGVGDRIRFFEGDGFGALPAGTRFDLVISNPPYIPTGEVATLEPEVRDYDPMGALDGGADGLDFYRRLAAEAGDYLRANGKVMAEFGDGQGPAVQELFEKQKWIVEALERDYTGRLRILVARRA